MKPCSSTPTLFKYICVCVHVYMTHGRAAEWCVHDAWADDSNQDNLVLHQHADTTLSHTMWRKSSPEKEACKHYNRVSLQNRLSAKTHIKNVHLCPIKTPRFVSRSHKLSEVRKVTCVDLHRASMKSGTHSASCLYSGCHGNHHDTPTFLRLYAASKASIAASVPPPPPPPPCCSKVGVFSQQTGRDPKDTLGCDELWGRGGDKVTHTMCANPSCVNLRPCFIRRTSCNTQNYNLLV